jgi:hypothetical protein
MSEEIAWAVGLFEGEGSFVRRRHCLCISMQSTDEDVLHRFRSVVGGKVYGPYFRKDRPSYKPFFQWKSTKHNEALKIAALMYPCLGQRRRKTLEDLGFGPEGESR